MPRNSSSPRILIVDDEESICDVLSTALKHEGYGVTSTTDPREAVSLLQQAPFDVVIQDIKMPLMDGLSLLRTIKSIRPETIVIVMTAYSTWDRAVEAMRLGCFSYIKKPFDTQLDVKVTLAKALLARDLQGVMKTEFDEVIRVVGRMIGDAPSMKAIYSVIDRVAATDSTILIHGESGVGKELVARALHYFSPRVSAPFIAVNCGAFTETLLESELFGHLKGAFTSAITDKMGLLEVANTGTFFLDEVSEISPQLQVKLLRVIEEKEFKPVGSAHTKKVDVRFIASTNKLLEKEVERGNFRKDLYYRLNVVPIHVPPLRERKEDIPLLGGYFLAKFSKEMGKSVTRFSESAKVALTRYDWPGNVRELENVIQRAVALRKGEEITEADLFDSLRPIATSPPPMSVTLKPLSAAGFDMDAELGNIEKEYLRQALKLAGGNTTQAAMLLKLSLRSFRYKLQKYDIKS